MTHNAQHYPHGWTCPTCAETYRGGSIVKRACCLKALETADPVIEYAQARPVHDEWPPAWTELLT